jgi:hypothetical protein
MAVPSTTSLSALCGCTRAQLAATADFCDIADGDRDPVPPCEDDVPDLG